MVNVGRFQEATARAAPWHTDLAIIPDSFLNYSANVRIGSKADISLRANPSPARSRPLA